MDRVLCCSESNRRTKRRKEMGYGVADAQQRLDAKAVAMGKVQRTDTEHNQDEQLAADAVPQDSVQTAYHCQSHMRQQQQLCRQQQAAAHAARPSTQQLLQQRRVEQQHLELDGSSSEVEGPIADDRYIKGTRLIIGGWFQACRGCNEPTAHTTIISKRDVPLCPRCQDKYNAMVHGCAPPGNVMPDPSIEPLHYWLPRLIGPVPPLSAQQRRDFCDALVLRQDDAWLQLIKVS